MIVANAGTTGTTVNRLAKLTGAPSTAVITATSDTENAIGIVTAGAGTTGNATITILGQASCDFDNATVAGDYFVISAITAGKCHDTGASFPTAQAAYGRVLSTNGASGTYVVELMTPDIAFQNGGNGKSRPGGAITNVQFFDTGTTFGGVSQFTWDKTNQILNIGGSGAASASLKVQDNTGRNITLGWNGFGMAFATAQELDIAGGDVYIYTGGGPSQRWRFDSSGNLTPSGSNGGFSIADTGHRVLKLWMYKSIDFSNVNDATASEPFISQARTWNAAGVTMHNFTSNVTNTASAAASTLFEWQVGGTTKWGMTVGGLPQVDQTITTAGTTGNQTINKAAGTVNVAAAGTTVTVTNSLVTTSSSVYVTTRTNDTTCSVKNVVPAAGSFVINLTAGCTAETSFGFFVVN